MNIIEQVYTTGACASGGYVARLVNETGDVWSIDSVYPDEHHVMDVRGEGNAKVVLMCIVDNKRGLEG